jgi:hypothetical protein
MLERRASGTAIVPKLFPNGKNETADSGGGYVNKEVVWLRGLDLNQRPLGYEFNQRRYFNELHGTDSAVKY